MKTLKIVSLAAVAAGLLTAAAMPAMAERGHGGWGGSGWHHRGGMGPHGGPHGAMRFMEWFDTDRDGKVTQAEIDAVISEQFTKADTDSSGGVSLDEFKVAFAEVFSEDRVRAFQRLDRDGDGKVSQAEYDRPAERMIARMGRVAPGQPGPGADQDDDAARGPDDGRGPGMRGPGPRGMHHRGMGMMLERFDADDSGDVTPEEVRKVRAEAFTAADKDGDKALTLVEFEEVWTARSDARMVRGFQRFDRDGDLTITKAEAERPFANLVQRMDRNDDGALSIDDRGGHRRGMKHRGDRGDN